MKRKLLTLLATIFTVLQAYPQGPTLNLVGGSPSLAKGSINTEVLAEIIQQKQEEVKRKVFRNTIIKGFNNSDYTKSLRNFATYHYLFNIMDVMTSGKNKTAITRSITESSTEFAYVFGLTLYIQQNLKETSHVKNFGALSISENVIDDAKVLYTDDKIKISDKVRDFNVLIDLCYDVIQNNTSLQEAFNFKVDAKDKEFKIWYESDNAYLIEYSKADAGKKADLDKLKIEVEGKLKDLSSLAKIGSDIESLLNGLEKSQNATVQQTASTISLSLKNKSNLQIKDDITNILANFSSNLTHEQDSISKDIINKIDENYDTYKHLITFYKGLKKSKYQDFSLTKDQYYAMKYIIVQFLDLAKNQYENNVVSTVIDFMIENTLVEYNDGESGLPKLEDKATSDDKGYLYIDIESLISSINQKFSPSNVKGLGIYVLPFFSIGTNYASFLHNNKLSSDVNGSINSINNLYFASEKIGVKWKIWNWLYTHSFDAGENFKYYNKKSTSRYWLRPQPKPTVSDVHLFIYGSGLLYNVANLKSTDKFDYAIAGAGVGMTFFNGLTANVSLACPFTDKTFNSTNMFIAFAFDIPIVEYIAGLRRK